jgi:hypothetical protein
MKSEQAVLPNPCLEEEEEEEEEEDRGISLLSTAYKILSNIILARLAPYINEIIEDHQCVFRHNKSTTDHILYILQILKKKLEYNGTVH